MPTAGRFLVPTFRFVTWNHLADGLDVSGGFIVDPAILPWTYRAPLVADILRDANADIVCLHEATEPSRIVREIGGVYSLLYAPKPDSPAFDKGAAHDGTAMLVRSERFAINKAETVHYCDGGSDIANQVALVAELVDKTCGHHVIICTTHLKAKGGVAQEAIRTHQIAQLLAIASRLRAGRAEVPVIIAGDLNSHPDGSVYATVFDDPACYSSVYNALPRGDGPASVYAKSEPAFTTWKFRTGGVEKKETIDYIFVSGLAVEGGVSSRDTPVAASLACSAVWELPTAEDIGAAALPSASFPSDHLHLGADFVWLEEPTAA